MEFGDILRQLRLERGLSQDELAALLGTTKQVISRWRPQAALPRIGTRLRRADLQARRRHGVHLRRG